VKHWKSSSSRPAANRAPFGRWLSRSFEWRGSLPIPGLFVGAHRFEIGPVGAGVRLEQSERFSGMLVPFVGNVLRATELGFRNMNEALKARAEAK